MLDFGARESLPTVLLIDDDLVSREVMATVLTMSGYTVHTAADGNASVDLLAAGECVPDVILMDAQMPGLSGTELIAQLRSRTHAAVYAISGSHAPDDVVAASDGFLLKPFGANTLHRLLEEHAAQSNPVPGPSLAADEPVINMETLAQLRAIMPESAVREIFQAVVADLKKKLATLQLAVVQRDATEIRRIGHAIKGGCAMAGAQQAARLGALLESCAASSSPGNSPGLSPQKDNHLDNSSALLKDLRAATLNLERMLEVEFPA
ncbi:MAG: response regulator [Terracidiphilus sp.]|jgi:CheY-like chemotaxis protein